MEIFYVYIYLDPRKPGQYKYGEYEFDYEPFYVGKGKDNRYRRIDRYRSSYFQNKINKIKGSKLEPIVELIKKSDEKKSFILESELINLIGRKDLNKGPLLNFTDGGEGISGYKFTNEIREIISKKQRREYSIIKESFESGNCKLLTKEEDYKNSKQKLEYICSNGHKYSTSWNDFLQGHTCPYCVRKKIDFPDIRKEFENRGYNLLTEEKDYKNNKQKLEYECPNRHQRSIRWCDFQQGKGCPYCAKNKIDFSDIKKEFEIRNYELLTEEEKYKNNKQKLEYECPKGHKHSIRWGNFQQGQDCPYCKKVKINFLDIQKEFKNRKCKLSTQEKDYKNVFTKLEYECPRGHKHSMSWNNFKQRENNYCPKCNRFKNFKNKK